MLYFSLEEEYLRIGEFISLFHFSKLCFFNHRDSNLFIIFLIRFHRGMMYWGFSGREAQPEGGEDFEMEYSDSNCRYRSDTPFEGGYVMPYALRKEPHFKDSGAKLTEIYVIVKGIMRAFLDISIAYTTLWC